MLKFIAYFKKKFNIKGFAEWLNYSIWNRAVFAYTSATLSIFVRYCLYSIHNGCWLPDYVTLYSAVFTYTIVTFFLFVFFSVYIDHDQKEKKKKEQEQQKRKYQ